MTTGRINQVTTLADRPPAAAAAGMRCRHPAAAAGSRPFGNRPHAEPQRLARRLSRSTERAVTDRYPSRFRHPPTHRTAPRRAAPRRAAHDDDDERASERASELREPV